MPRDLPRRSELNYFRELYCLEHGIQPGKYVEQGTAIFPHLDGIMPADTSAGFEVK